MTTMDEQAASQEGSPIPTGTVMVAKLVERDGVVSEWNPILGASDVQEFVQWAGEYLASMTAEAMESSVVVERWTAERWAEFIADRQSPIGGTR